MPEVACPAHHENAHVNSSVMPPVLTSRTNPRVRALRAALAGRAPDGLIAIESPHLLREALASGLRAITVFLREDRADLESLVPPQSEVVLLSADVFDTVAATEQSQGVAALLDRPESRYLPRTGDLLLVLDGVQDPGNAGTLLRSAEAFGAAAVLLASGTADIWSGKALRASAGAAFRTPAPRWTPALDSALRAAGIRVLAAVADDKAHAVHEMDLTAGCALVVGNEGRGVTAEMLSRADDLVTLPMLGKTESLNAGVAGSVLLYEAARQRSHKRGGD